MPIRLKVSDAQRLGIDRLVQTKPSVRADVLKKKAADKAADPESVRRERKHRLFEEACKAHDLPIPEAEYQFAPPRKWRFDWIFEGWLALEIQGGLFIKGRHTQGAWLLKEYEKLNEAVIRGYAVLMVTPQQVESGEAFALVARALGAREEQS